MEASCGDAEDVVNELALPHYIVFVQPSDLPFPNQMPGLVTVDRPQSPFRRPKPQTRRNSLLNDAMILLDHVVQIRGGTTATAPTEFAGLLQLANRSSVRRMSIHINDPWADPAAPRQ